MQLPTLKSLVLNWVQGNWRGIHPWTPKIPLKMGTLIALLHRHSHSASWQLQLEILNQNVFWVRVALVEYTKGIWNVLIRWVCFSWFLCLWRAGESCREMKWSNASFFFVTHHFPFSPQLSSDSHGNDHEFCQHGSELKIV